MTHATTKYRWSYEKKDGKKEQGAFFVPLGEESVAESWLSMIVGRLLGTNEKYDRSKATLEDFGGEDKIR